jgi:hypothetical protein
MSWSSVASNQMVTFTNAQTSGIPLKPGQSHVTSNQCMTKSEIQTKYNVQTTPMNSYASNQLVPKSQWVSAGSVYNTYSVRAANTIVDICDVASFATAYSNTLSFQVGMTLYSNINLTITLSGTHVIFDTVVYTMSSGVVGAATGDICPGGAF